MIFINSYSNFTFPAASRPTIRMRISFFPNMRSHTREKWSPMLAKRDSPVGGLPCHRRRLLWAATARRALQRGTTLRSKGIRHPPNERPTDTCQN